MRDIFICKSGLIFKSLFATPLVWSILFNARVDSIQEKTCRHVNIRDKYDLKNECDRRVYSEFIIVSIRLHRVIIIIQLRKRKKKNESPAQIVYRSSDWRL